MTSSATRGPRLLPYFLAAAFSLGALASVIALLGEIRDEFGLSETALGVIVGTGFLASFLSQLTLGKFADRGYAPLMVRVGLAAAALSMIGFALGDSFFEFVVARAALGLSVGIAQPAIRRTVILAEAGETGRNIGRLGVAEVSGFAIAPAIAAVLADVGSLDLPFYVMAVAVVGLAFSMGTLESDDGAKTVGASSAVRLLKNPVITGTLLIVTSQFLLIGAWEAVWSVMLVDLGAATWEVGLSFTVFALPMGIAAHFGGPLAQKTGGLRIAVIGLVSGAALSIAYGFVDPVWGLIGVSFVAGIGDGLGFTAGLYVYSQAVPEERQASAQGLMGATEVLFGGLASLLGAWLYDVHGRAVVWVLVPLLTLAVIAIGLTMRRRYRAPVPVLEGLNV